MDVLTESTGVVHAVKPNIELTVTKIRDRIVFLPFQTDIQGMEEYHDAWPHWHESLARAAERAGTPINRGLAA